MSNWPQFWTDFFAGWTVALILASALAWFVILPTVGLLYSFGVLP
ncbi:hypothetical protein [Borborobacter arsenicus]|nr:hypothetical protein [Pseudaminobacter arsenicus]